MRLVLVHGINQQARSEKEIKAEWLGALRQCMCQDDHWPASRLTEIRAPFYGDRLFALSETRSKTQAVAQGPGDLPDDFAEFAAPALLEMAQRLAPDAPEFTSNEPIAQGAGPHKQLVKVMARILERVSPWHGEIALRLLGQAHAYLKREHIAEEIDAIVRPILRSDEPTIIVAHSLGTILTFKLLREMAEKGEATPCPLWLTLGSPLAIDSIRRSFPLPRKRPDNVARWFNGADPADFVALRPVLDETTFGTGIENIEGIRNGYADPHAIRDYLSNQRIGAIICAAIVGALAPVAGRRLRQAGPLA